MKSRFLIVGLVVVAAAVAGGGWLLTRDASLQWAVRTAEARWPGRLSIENARGSLLSEITADRVAWVDESRRVIAERIRLEWSPWRLLTGTLAFDEVHASSVTFAAADSQPPLDVRLELRLPLSLRFDDVRADSLTLIDGDGVEQTFAQVAFSLAAGPRQWKGKLDALPTAWGTWRGDASVGTVKPFPIEATFELDPEEHAPELPALSIKGSAEGNVSMMVIKGEAKAQTSVAHATVQVEPMAPIPVRAIDASWKEVDARHIVPSAPATALGGTLQATTDAEGVLRGTLSMENRAAGTLDQDRVPVTAVSSAIMAGPQRWALEDLVLDLGAGGRLVGDAWISAEQAGLTLRTERLDLNGIHAKLRPTQLSGALQTRGPFVRQEVSVKLGEARRALALDAVVEPTLVTVRRARVSVGAARIDASGTVGLDERHAFTLTAGVKGFDPSEFGHYPKASVNGSLRAKGEIAPLLRVDADATLASSSLFGLPASGRGRVVSKGVDQIAIAMDVAATVGKTTLSARGNLVDPQNPHALNVAFTFKGHDLAELYTITGLSVPSTPPYALSGHLALKDRVWSVRRFHGQVGRSDLAGDVSVDLNGKRPFMRADLTSERLDMRDLGGFVGVDYSASAADPAPVRVLPQSEFQHEKLNAIDADVRFTGRSIRNPQLPLRRMNARLQLHGGLVRLDPLHFRAAGGEIDGRIAMDARHASMVTVADIQARNLQLNRLAPTVQALFESAGTIDGRTELTMHGNSTAAMLGSANGELAVAMKGGAISDLVLRLADLDVANSLLALAQGDREIPIRCFVGEFAAVDGVLKPRTLVLDTEHTIVRGEGAVNLRDERLALQLIAQPKDGSVLALRGPIRMEGTFASPAVYPDLTNAFLRGGIAVALAAVAPPAALLPFLQLGKKEHVDCEPLITDASRFIQARSTASRQGSAAGQRRAPAPRTGRNADIASNPAERR